MQFFLPHSVVQHYFQSQLHLHTVGQKYTTCAHLHWFCFQYVHNCWAVLSLCQANYNILSRCTLQYTVRQYCRIYYTKLTALQYHIWKLSVLLCNVIFMLYEFRFWTLVWPGVHRMK